MGVDDQTVLNWERNRTRVATRFLPQVVAFLGYDPREEARLFGERIRALRERHGLSQSALAAELGVNASTVTAWERGRVRKPFAAIRRKFEEFLAGG
jgi:transcriptional regulator with XRE-family HTH domain